MVGKPTTRQRVREYRWMRQYAFRPRHIVRQQMQSYLQAHTIHTNRKDNGEKLEDSDCIALHVRRGDIAFGKVMAPQPSASLPPPSDQPIISLQPTTNDSNRIIVTVVAVACAVVLMAASFVGCYLYRIQNQLNDLSKHHASIAVESLEDEDDGDQDLSDPTDEGDNLEKGIKPMPRVVSGGTATTTTTLASSLAGSSHHTAQKSNLMLDDSHNSKVMMVSFPSSMQQSACHGGVSPDPGCKALR